MEHDEYELIKCAQQGDDDAFALLYKKYFDFVYKYLIKITMNTHLSEEITQEAMTKSYINLSYYNGKAKFSTWLITIATNTYTDYLRKRKRERFFFWQKSEELTTNLKWHVTNNGIEWSELIEALSKLEDEYKMPLILKHYYGYSYDDIAEILNIKEGTVKSRVHYGSEKLRKELR
ncbi:MAG: sigY [Bacillales bacterium]|nr:sigY [Bacillales bacterium]